MSKRRGILSALLLVLMLAAIVLYSMGRSQRAEEEVFDEENTVVIWYADEAMTNFLSSAALSYSKNSSVKIRPVLVSAVDFLEHVNDASVREDSEEAMPDLVIMTNDNLEKAYLAGLAAEIADGGFWVNEENYPKAALSAVSYHDRYVGYPFYFETALLLYNETYMEQLAQKTIEQELITEEFEAASGDDRDAEPETDVTKVPDVSQEQIEDKIGVIIPSTIDDILSFADEYDAPEQVEAVFRWDVSDIFYNYFMVGQYMNVGTDTGDDPEQIDIYNEDTIACLKVYQNLNQFFSIDAKETSYDSILQEFMEGKTVFTVATTDAISKLERAKESGEFTYDYGVTTLPDVSPERGSRTLSVTNAIVVNGYSDKKAVANDFAKYLAYDTAQELYDRTDKIAARKNVTYKNDNINAALREYENSVPLPKMLETSNFWVQLEICFTNIWNGADVNASLKELSEQIKTQVTGTEYVEEPIAEPVPETQEDDAEEDQEQDNADTEASSGAD
ncbi:MAG: sugar ABC transporter substrate-binding protein [Lachnospiraceae bacterium]|nr:sugar ABC transporter substrate-binding protein [Lachnospiraceae bacterium]